MPPLSESTRERGPVRSNTGRAAEGGIGQIEDETPHSPSSDVVSRSSPSPPNARTVTKSAHSSIFFVSFAHPLCSFEGDDCAGKSYLHTRKPRNKTHVKKNQKLGDSKKGIFRTHGQPRLVSSFILRGGRFSLFLLSVPATATLTICPPPPRKK